MLFRRQEVLQPYHNKYNATEALACANDNFDRYLRKRVGKTSRDIAKLQEILNDGRVPSVQVLEFARELVRVYMKELDRDHYGPRGKQKCDLFINANQFFEQSRVLSQLEPRFVAAYFVSRMAYEMLDDEEADIAQMIKQLQEQLYDKASQSLIQVNSNVLYSLIEPIANAARTPVPEYVSELAIHCIKTSSFKNAKQRHADGAHQDSARFLRPSRRMMVKIDRPQQKTSAHIEPGEVIDKSVVNEFTFVTYANGFTEVTAPNGKVNTIIWDPPRGYAENFSIQLVPAPKNNSFNDVVYAMLRGTHFLYNYCLMAIDRDLTPRLVYSHSMVSRYFTEDHNEKAHITAILPYNDGISDDMLLVLDDLGHLYALSSMRVKRGFMLTDTQGEPLQLASFHWDFVQASSSQSLQAYNTDGQLVEIDVSHVGEHMRQTQPPVEPLNCEVSMAQTNSYT